MTSPDNSVESLWQSQIIPRVERFVNSPVNQKVEAQLVYRPKRQSLGFAVCRIVIAESHGLRNACITLVPDDFLPDAPPQIIPQTLDLWFSYSAAAIHLATRIEQGIKPNTPPEKYYDPKDPIRPSVNAIKMLQWQHNPRNLTSLLAVDSTGRFLVDYILKSRVEPFRREDIHFNNPAATPANITNKLVELGASRFNKYLDYWVVGA